jgi:hypothetical protein
MSARAASPEGEGSTSADWLNDLSNPAPKADAKPGVEMIPPPPAEEKPLPGLSSPPPTQPVAPPMTGKEGGVSTPAENKEPSRKPEKKFNGLPDQPVTVLPAANPAIQLVIGSRETVDAGSIGFTDGNTEPRATFGGGPIGFVGGSNDYHALTLTTEAGKEGNTARWLPSIGSTQKPGGEEAQVAKWEDPATEAKISWAEDSAADHAVTTLLLTRQSTLELYETQTAAPTTGRFPAGFFAHRPIEAANASYQVK